MSQEQLVGGIGHLYGIELLQYTIYDAAKFAVEDHNQKSEIKLELVGVEKAAIQIDCGVLTFLTVKALDHQDGNHKLFITSVVEIPWFNKMGSVGLEYVCKASEEPPLPRHLGIQPCTDHFRTLADFAVEHHNEEELKNLELVDIVRVSKFRQTTDNLQYTLTLLVREQDKYVVYKTDVTEGRWEDNLMESAGLTYVCEALPSIMVAIATSSPPPTLITPEIKALADYALEDHYQKTGMRLEFVSVSGHCVGGNCVENGCKYVINLQLIEGGKHKIFKTKLTEKHEGASMECSGLEYVSEAPPCPKAQVDWISPELIDKTCQLEEQMHAEGTAAKLNTC